MDLSELYRLTKQNETADILRRAKALIDTPEKWCQHSMKVGDRICSIYALNSIDVYGYQRYGNFLVRAAMELFGHYPSIVNSLGHAETMQMWDRAIELAEQGSEPL